MSRWSSGQDVALSRLNQGFDSPTRYHPTLLNVEPFNRSAGFLFSYPEGYAVFPVDFTPKA